MCRGNREQGARQQRMGQLLFGLLMIAVGAVCWNDPEPGWTLELDLFLRFWPALLIVSGLPQLVFPRNDGDQAWGLFVVGAGGALLLQKLGVVVWTFGQIWPVLLILVGVLLLLKSLRAADVASGETR
jgi:hypothetical protein